eukprot:7390166-Prymnesium_polylepis.1
MEAIALEESSVDEDAAKAVERSIVIQLKIVSDRANDMVTRANTTRADNHRQRGVINKVRPARAPTTRSTRHAQVARRTAHCWALPRAARRPPALTPRPPSHRARAVVHHSCGSRRARTTTMPSKSASDCSSSKRSCRNCSKSETASRVQPAPPELHARAVHRAPSAESNPRPLSSTQNAVHRARRAFLQPSLPPHVLPESASPATQQFRELCAFSLKLPSDWSPPLGLPQVPGRHL